MLLLDKRNRAHPEDGVAAPGSSKDKKCPAELRAERAVRAYFSLDKTRPLGLEAFFLDILAYPPEDRVPQFMFIAEMLSISTGLLLFFAQTLAVFEEGMSKLGLVSAAMATAAVLIFISVSIMLMMFGITASKMSSSVKHVVALGEAIVAPAVGFVYGCYLSIVAFALHALDSVGGTLGVGVCAFACLTLVFVYFYIGTHICTVEALATYHQSFWTQMDAVNGIAWVASGRRALTERASHELDALMRVLPEDVRRVVGGETEEEK